MHVSMRPLASASPLTWEEPAHGVHRLCHLPLALVLPPVSPGVTQLAVDLGELGLQELPLRAVEGEEKVRMQKVQRGELE
jgi:hypothetical protein